MVISTITLSHPQWGLCVDLYLNAFPVDERRERRELEQMLDTQGYSFMTITIDEIFRGFFEIWEFDDFRFLEHLAILPEHHGKGIGSEAMIQLMSISKKPLLLEAEKPVDDISHRRILFYKRLGLMELDIDYSQPPFYPGKQSVPMILFSSHHLDLKEVTGYIDIIRKKVYK